MTFIACGLNHKTAPIMIREQLAPSNEQQRDILRDMMTANAAHEVALLSTCNRTEIYADTDADPQTLLTLLAKHSAISTNQLNQHSYIRQDNDAIRHLLRVACGVDSMIVGEPQILGQLKQAYQHAQQIGSIGTQLSTLFQRVFATSKRIRTKTALGQQASSVAYIAAKLVSQNLTDLSNCHCLLIGTGETATLTARYLQQFGIQHFTVTGRTEEKVMTQARLLNGNSLDINALHTHMHQADLVISATACPLTFITHDMVTESLIQRNNKPIHFVDLAVPRDIEPSIANLPSVSLYNIDDLQHIMQSNKKERSIASMQAEAMIEAELINYQHWQRINRASHVIHNYRQKIQNTAQDELQLALEKLDKGASPKDVLQQFQHRLVNKMLHQPTIRLRQAAVKQQTEILDVAETLFEE